MSNHLKDQILTTFKREWQAMLDSQPVNATYQQREEQKKATSAEIVRQLMPLLEAHAAGLPQVICELAQIRGADMGYELAIPLREALEQFDPAGHYHLALFANEQAPWFIRRDAAGYLAQFPTDEVQEVLRKVLFQPQEIGEIRTAALRALVAQQDKSIIPALQKLDAEAGKSWHGGNEQILQAHGKLGDLSSARELMELRNNPWSHRQEHAEKGLRGLEQSVGGAEALAATLTEPNDLREASYLEQVALHDVSASVRRWALDRLVELRPDEAQSLLLHALGSEDWHEQQSASKALIALPNPPVALLRQQVAESNLTDNQRGWAAITLKQLGHEVDISGFREPLVALPNRITPDLRRTIVSTWATHPSWAEPGTDVRWLLEGYRKVEMSEYDEREKALQQKLPALITAWQAAGFKVSEFVSAGEHHQQGGGNYYIGEVNKVQVLLSELGPYAACWENLEESLLLPQLPAVAAVLEQNGWHVLNEKTLSTIIPDLPIYFFGRRKPLPVRDLLFYWQD